MAEVHVIVDSTANLPADMLSRQATLHVVPLTVSIGDRQWPETALSTTELFSLTAAGGSHPKTSQPSPGDFLAVVSPLIESGSEVVIITLVGSLSGTAQSARTAAQLAGTDRVWVVDSGTTASGMVKLAQQALAAAADGAGGATIAKKLEVMAGRTRTLFVPATLEYLHKGGRIGGAAALFGAILQIRPVLCLREGRVEVLDKVRTHARAVARMVDEVCQSGALDYIDVVHIEAAEAAAELVHTLQSRCPGVPVSVSTCGAVLGTHLGPGLLGIIYQEACDNH